MFIISKKVTGDGAVHTFASQIGVTAAKWVQASIGASNSAAVLVGGPEVTSTVGFPLNAPYGGQPLPPISEMSNLYYLDRCYYYAAVGDIFWVLVGVD